MKSRQEDILYLRTANTNNTECRNDECIKAVFLPVWMEATSLTGNFLQLSGAFMKSLICRISLPFIP